MVVLLDALPMIKSDGKLVLSAKPSPYCSGFPIEKLNRICS